MNIGILTFHYADNYGALLQAFALNKYLSRSSHKVFFIDYIPKKEQLFYSDKILLQDGIKPFIKKTISHFQRKDSIKTFADFRSRYFSIITLDKLEGFIDILLVGSDQVWNEKIVGDLKPYLFANVTNDIKKISYAASIGSSQVTDKAKALFSRYLHDFSAISVRENTTELLLQSLGINAKTVVDPVFLLDETIWNGYAKPKTDIKGRYILLYLLRIDETIISEANKYAREHKIPIYYIHPMGYHIKGLVGKRIKNVGPLEFIWLIKYADMVFTNSFHAVSFCAIFKKSFFHASKAELGNRVSSLLSYLGINNMTDGVYKVNLKNEGFSFMISNSKRFLDNNIGM